MKSGRGKNEVRARKKRSPEKKKMKSGRGKNEVRTSFQ